MADQDDPALTHVLAFDSGIGGYGIVAALRRHLAGVRISMLADNAFYPYGEHDDATLIARIEAVIGEAIRRLAPDIVVIACNTASTVALDAMRRRFEQPFVGCVPPIKWAATLSRSRHIGLLATAATVRRPYVDELARRFAPDCRLIAHGARGLADLAERAFRGQSVPETALRRELDLLFGQPGGEAIDTVCIGCTHYSFLLDRLGSLSPAAVRWLDPADAVARHAGRVLAGMPAGSSAGRASGPEAALFTAPPTDPELLSLPLARLGYRSWQLFSV